MDDRTSGARHPLGVVIVDDEEPARLLLREILSRVPEVEILGECANGFEAVKAVSEKKPDVLVLDIEMPKLDGFEVVELLDRDVAVVFVTAYDSYAVKAFEVHAVDYVLKPVRPERLREALERARGRASGAPPVAPAELAAAVRGARRWLERVVVRDGSRIHIIPVDRLDLAIAEDDYVALKSGGKKYRKPQTLSSLAASLDPERFVRVHRSFLVNLDRLERIELYARNSHAAILSDGSRIPISREGHARLTQILEGRR